MHNKLFTSQGELDLNIQDTYLTDDELQKNLQATSQVDENIELRELNLDLMQKIIDEIKIPSEDIDMLKNLQVPRSEMSEKKEILLQSQKINALLKKAKLEIAFLSYNKLLDILNRLTDKHPDYNFDNCKNILKKFIESLIIQLNEIKKASCAVKNYINLFKKANLLQIQSHELELSDSNIGIYDLESNHRKQSIELKLLDPVKMDINDRETENHSIISKGQQSISTKAGTNSLIGWKELLEKEKIGLQPGSFNKSNKQFVRDMNRPETDENRKLFLNRVIGRTYPREIRPALAESMEFRNLNTLMLNKMTASDVTSWNWGDTKVQNPIEYLGILFRKNNDLNRNFLTRYTKLADPHGRVICYM